MASETGRAQTLHVFACLQVDTADRPMHIRGCDITYDQVRELELSSLRYLICDSTLSGVSKVKNRRG